MVETSLCCPLRHVPTFLPSHIVLQNMRQLLEAIATQGLLTVKC